MLGGHGWLTTSIASGMKQCRSYMDVIVFGFMREFTMNLGGSITFQCYEHNDKTKQHKIFRLFANIAAK